MSRFEEVVTEYANVADRVAKLPGMDGAVKQQHCILVVLENISETLAMMYDMEREKHENNGSDKS